MINYYDTAGTQNVQTTGYSIEGYSFSLAQRQFRLQLEKLDARFGVEDAEFRLELNQPRITQPVRAISPRRTFRQWR